MIVIIKNIAIEKPGLLNRFLKEQGFETAIVDVSARERLPELGGVQGVIILGGPMNVYETERYPFLADETRYIQEILKREIPLLGICLGAQLLAHACGAKVKKSPFKEIGWFRVRLTDEGKKDILFSGLRQKMDVFQWHEDMFEIPEGGVLLAESLQCPHQAFRVGSCAWGLQFHPEMITVMLKRWLDHYNEPLDENGTMYDYFRCQDMYLKQTKMICSNFAVVIKESCASAKTAFATNALKEKE